MLPLSEWQRDLQRDHEQERDRDGDGHWEPGSVQAGPPNAGRRRAEILTARNRETGEGAH